MVVAAAPAPCTVELEALVSESPLVAPPCPCLVVVAEAAVAVEAQVATASTTAAPVVVEVVHLGSVVEQVAMAAAWISLPTRRPPCRT